MAYELTYFYHDKKPEGGGYNTEERKELKKRLGTGFDDIPLDQVANAIIRQLARRDIWVVDVEVCEFTKKKVSFKESNDGSGIVLKNKKFSLDNNSSALVVQDISVDVVDEDAPVAVAPAGGGSEGLNLIHALHKHAGKKKAAGNVNLVESPVNPNRVQFWATFEPHPFTNEARQKGLKFTVGKRYPVHRSKENPDGANLGQKFYMTDDTKKIVEVDEKYFAIVGAGLVGDDEVEGGFSQNNSGEPEPKLAYWSHMKGGDQQAPQPALRKTIKDIDPKYKNIPMDDGSIPDTFFEVPDIRKKK